MRKVLCLAALTSLVLSGCAPKQESTEELEKKQQAQRGETLFIDNCAKCHPRGGRGDYLKRIPATLLVRRSESELIAWIQGSDKHREMPNFTDLTTEEKRDLASYLLSQIPSR